MTAPFTDHAAWILFVWVAGNPAGMPVPVGLAMLRAGALTRSNFDLRTILARSSHWRAHARIAALGVALPTSTLGCQRAKSAAAPAAPPAVSVAEVVARTVSIVREYTGRTEAVPTVELHARVAGVLEQDLVEEAGAVTRGQTLFVIQREEYAAALESARVQPASLVDRTRAQLEERKADLGKARQM